MKINAATDLPHSDTIAPSCAKFYKPLISKKKKKSINTDDIGTPSYNMLLDLLKCQVKKKKLDCIKVEKSYSACHSSIMGVGNYNNRRNCNEEMERLYHCVVNSNASE